MSDFLHFAATLREQMQATLSRSDVLRVLIWPVVVLLSSLLIALKLKAPNWVLIGLGGFAALTVFLYLVAFVFLLFVDRDALRSEKYSLHKLAIEHGLYGDSKIGLRDVEQIGGAAGTPAITVQKTGPTGEDRG